jgi:hypothetical protein
LVKAKNIKTSPQRRTGHRERLFPLYLLRLRIERFDISASDRRIIHAIFQPKMLEKAHE